MKHLEKQFTGIGEVKGFAFKQIKETDEGFIYEVSDSGKAHYEVFERKIVNTMDWETKEITGQKVAYPKAKAFGLWAWTAKDIVQAEMTLRNITAAAHARKDKKNGPS